MIRPSSMPVQRAAPPSPRSCAPMLGHSGTSFPEPLRHGAAATCSTAAETQIRLSNPSVPSDSSARRVQAQPCVMNDFWSRALGLSMKAAVLTAQKVVDLSVLWRYRYVGGEHNEGQPQYLNEFDWWLLFFGIMMSTLLAAATLKRHRCALLRNRPYGWGWAILISVLQVGPLAEMIDKLGDGVCWGSPDDDLLLGSMVYELKGSRYGENLMRGLRKLSVASSPISLLSSWIHSVQSFCVWARDDGGDSCYGECSLELAALIIGFACLSMACADIVLYVFVDDGFVRGHKKLVLLHYIIEIAARLPALSYFYAAMSLAKHDGGQAVAVLWLCDMSANMLLMLGPSIMGWLKRGSSWRHAMSQIFTAFLASQVFFGVNLALFDPRDAFTTINMFFYLVKYAELVSMMKLINEQRPSSKFFNLFCEAQAAVALVNVALVWVYIPFRKRASDEQCARRSWEPFPRLTQLRPPDAASTTSPRATRVRSRSMFHDPSRALDLELGTVLDPQVARLPWPAANAAARSEEDGSVLECLGDILEALCLLSQSQSWHNRPTLTRAMVVDVLWSLVLPWEGVYDDGSGGCVRLQLLVLGNGTVSLTHEAGPAQVLADMRPRSCPAPSEADPDGPAVVESLAFVFHGTAIQVVWEGEGQIVGSFDGRCIRFFDKKRTIWTKRSAPDVPTEDIGIGQDSGRSARACMSNAEPVLGSQAQPVPSSQFIQAPSRNLAEPAPVLASQSAHVMGTRSAPVFGSPGNPVGLDSQAQTGASQAAPMPASRGGQAPGSQSVQTPVSVAAPAQEILRLVLQQLVLALRWEPTFLGLANGFEAGTKSAVDASQRPLLTFLVRYALTVRDEAFLAQVYWSLWCLSNDPVDNGNGAYDKARWVLVATLHGDVEFWDGACGIPLDNTSLLSEESVAADRDFRNRARRLLLRQRALWRQSLLLSQLDADVQTDPTERTRAVQRWLKERMGRMRASSTGSNRATSTSNVGLFPGRSSSTGRGLEETHHSTGGDSVAFPLPEQFAIAPDLDNEDFYLLDSATTEEVGPLNLVDTSNTSFVSMPIDPGVQFVGVNISGCRVLASKTGPLLLSCRTLPASSEDATQDGVPGLARGASAVSSNDIPFSTSNSYGLPEEGHLQEYMVKVGDDLRQDQLVLQMLAIMRRVWRERLPAGEASMLHLAPYRVLAMTPRAGYVKFVPGGVSLSKALSKSRGNLRAWLDQHRPNSMPLSEVLNNLCGSVAAYCVATYVLGIGDRHLDNLLITPSGHFFHIDFGFIFGEDPKPFAPLLRLPQQVASALLSEPIQGSHPSVNTLLDQCLQLAGRAYIALRRSMRLWTTLLQITGEAGGAGCSRLRARADAAVVFVRERLRSDLGDFEEEAAAAEFLLILCESTEALYPTLTDKVHQFAAFF